jgi:SWI/SNF-related matrix-associated actin-dependent regulator of chromatin subfamily A-like protein 1
MPHLYDFQTFGARFLAERKVGLLADDMGLGKTVQAIAAADHIGAKNICIISPTIARDVWTREFKAWQKLSRTIQVIRSAADAKHLTAEIIITSYALAPTILQALRARRFDVLILDEAQNLKSIQAKRTRAIYGTGGLIGRVSRVWLLSGTIMPNNPSEIWPHYRLFGGQLGYSPFIDRYCLVKESMFGPQIVGANRHRLPELATFLRPFVLQRQQNDVLPDLPPMRFGHVPVRSSQVPPQPDLSVEELAILGRLERGESISVAEQMKLATLRRWTGVAKAPAVIEHVQSMLDSGVEKVVIFCVHLAVIDAIHAAFGDIAAVIRGDAPHNTRQETIDAFQGSSIPRVLILQIATAGTALTLHRANRVVFAETTWTPADVVQAAKRCHRIGQRSSVLAQIISLASSIDERVGGVLMRKASELAHFEQLVRKEVA